jgi:hypothetical protein
LASGVFDPDDEDDEAFDFGTWSSRSQGTVYWMASTY